MKKSHLYSWWLFTFEHSPNTIHNVHENRAAAPVRTLLSQLRMEHLLIRKMLRLRYANHLKRLFDRNLRLRNKSP